MFIRWPRNKLTRVVGGFFGNNRFLTRFQYMSEKDLILKQLTAVTVDRMPKTGEADVPTIYVITVEMVDL